MAHFPHLKGNAVLAINKVHLMDSLEGVKALPTASVQTCVTSPPYYQQRDYGFAGQYGMESNPEAYVNALVVLFEQVRRVLKPDGTLWLNLGDGYWGSSKVKAGLSKTQGEKPGRKSSKAPKCQDYARSTHHPSIKNKDLIGIPWSTAFALRAAGWHLRQEIIWAKPNGMPESIGDRCTRNHEQIFMFANSANYYYDADAIKTPIKDVSKKRMERAIGSNHKYVEGAPGKKSQTICQPRDNKQAGHGPRHQGFNERWKAMGDQQPKKANRRSVWTIAPKGTNHKHFASFPIEIPTLCISASTRPGDLVLDPFMGSGTTAIAAALLGRPFIGFDRNPAYVEIAAQRLIETMGMYLPSPIENWHH